MADSMTSVEELNTFENQGNVTSVAGNAKSKAEMMAGLVENWLANPVSKVFLKFITKRGKNGRRAEKILGSYAGINYDLNFGDKVSKHIIHYILETFRSHMDLTEDNLKTQLRDGVWRKGLASVLEGLAWRGPEKPFTSACPFLVVWNFTNLCNLHCKHCYQDASLDRLVKELTREEALKAVDEMADSGLAFVAMSGGEPLIRRDFFNVADRITDHEMGIAVATNATLLNEETAKRLKKYYNIYLQISLDGLKDTHNNFRGADCFDKVIQGIKNAKKEDIGVGISMAVTKLNINDVPHVIDLVEDLGVDIFMHYNFIPVGRGHNIVNMDLTPYERERLLNEIYEEGKIRRIKLLSTAPQFARVCADYGEISLTHFDAFGRFDEWRDDVRFLADFVGGCGAGRLYWAMQPNGDLSPCVFMPIVSRKH
jgi:MoaA/NifB/PqqE/SkfB family radical SAM enzyme